MKTLPLTRTALVLALGLASTLAWAKDPAPPAQGTALTAAEISAKLTAQGYQDVRDIEFDDGLWKAEARASDGRQVDLKIDPASGRIYPDKARASRMSEQDVRAALATAGYAKVHDVEFDDGLWKARAENRAGQSMKLQLDPDDGKVVAAERD